MRKRLLLILSILLLAACQSVMTSTPAVSATAPTVPTLIPLTPSPASSAETIAHQYAVAYETKNVDQYFSLFSSDAITMDYGGNYGPYRIMDIKDDVSAAFASKYFQYKVTSSFASADGRFAALEGIYTDWIHGGNQTASAPCLVILEIKDSKIVKESIYYNGAVFG